SQRARGIAQVIGMMMSINAVKHLDTHSEKPSRFPFVDTGLHEPGRCSVTERVWSDSSAKTSQAHGRCKRSFDETHAGAVPFHEVLLDQPFSTQRRRCARSRGGMGTGGRRLLLSASPSGSR